MIGGFCHRNRPPDERAAFRRFAELCQLEPRLTTLLLEVMAKQPTTWSWYRHVKPRLYALVGWEAERRELRTCEAYDVAYEVLYSMGFDPPEPAPAAEETE
jgi:hypothetical protein